MAQCSNECWTQEQGSVEARQRNARGHAHKAQEVAVWGRFSTANFPLPGVATTQDDSVDSYGVTPADIGVREPVCAVSEEVGDAEAEARQRRVAELATSPAQLRPVFAGDYGRVVQRCTLLAPFTEDVGSRQQEARGRAHKATEVASWGCNGGGLGANAHLPGRDGDYVGNGGGDCMTATPKQELTCEEKAADLEALEMRRGALATSFEELRCNLVPAPEEIEKFQTLLREAQDKHEGLVKAKMRRAGRFCWSSAYKPTMRGETEREVMRFSASLRAAQGNTGLDMELPDSGGWAMVETHVIPGDHCTEEQLKVCAVREKNANFWLPSRVEARASKQKCRGDTIIPEFFALARRWPEELSEVVASSPDPAAIRCIREKRDQEERRQLAMLLDEQAAKGAKFTLWLCDGHWPEPGEEWMSAGARCAAKAAERQKEILEMRRERLKTSEVIGKIPRVLYVFNPNKVHAGAFHILPKQRNGRPVWRKIIPGPQNYRQPKSEPNIQHILIQLAAPSLYEHALASQIFTGGKKWTPSESVLSRWNFCLRYKKYGSWVNDPIYYSEKKSNSLPHEVVGNWRHHESREQVNLTISMEPWKLFVRGPASLKCCLGNYERRSDATHNGRSIWGMNGGVHLIYWDDADMRWCVSATKELGKALIRSGVLCDECVLPNDVSGCWQMECAEPGNWEDSAEISINNVGDSNSAPKILFVGIPAAAVKKNMRLREVVGEYILVPAEEQQMLTIEMLEWRMVDNDGVQIFCIKNSNQNQICGWAILIHNSTVLHCDLCPGESLLPDEVETWMDTGSKEPVDGVIITNRDFTPVEGHIGDVTSDTGFIHAGDHFSFLSCITHHVRAAVALDAGNLEEKKLEGVFVRLKRFSVFGLDHLQKFRLDAGSLSPQGVRELAEWLKVSVTLQEFTLSKLAAVGIDLICEALEFNDTLELLDVSRSNIGPTGCSAIAKALKSNSGLRTLKLSGNEITDDGAIEFAAALKVNATLRELDLDNNSIGCDGCDQLASIVPGSAGLEKLDLSNNKDSSRQRIVTNDGIPRTFFLSRIPSRLKIELQPNFAPGAPIPISPSHLAASMHASLALDMNFPTLGSQRAACNFSRKRLQELVKIYLPHEGEKIDLPATKLLADCRALALNLTLFHLRLGGCEIPPRSGVPLCGQQVDAALQGDTSVGVDGECAHFDINIDLMSAPCAPAWIPRVPKTLQLTLAVGEERRYLLSPDGNGGNKESGELRVILSRHKDYQSDCGGPGVQTNTLVTLIWSPPTTLRGVPIGQLSGFWTNQYDRVRKQLQAQSKETRRFQEGINMYHANEKSILCETLASQSSLAELFDFGPVDTFVSHYWGHDVSNTLEALRKQAGDRHDCRVWICSIANNQRCIQEELGNDVDQSPFARALRSDTCRAAALMLDKDAAALTRFWCLYEIMTVIQLQSSSVDITLDLCTSSGVVSRGDVEVDLALKMSNVVADIDVAKAGCSNEQDRAMIESAIIERVGGYDAMNTQVRRCVGNGLHEVEKKQQNKFREAEKRLGLRSDTTDLDTAQEEAPQGNVGDDGVAPVDSEQKVTSKMEDTVHVKEDASTEVAITNEIDIGAEVSERVTNIGLSEALKRIAELEEALTRAQAERDLAVQDLRLYKKRADELRRRVRQTMDTPAGSASQAAKAASQPLGAFTLSMTTPAGDVDNEDFMSWLFHSESDFLV